MSRHRLLSENFDFWIVHDTYEFAKLRAFRAHVLYLSMWLRASLALRA